MSATERLVEVAGGRCRLLEKGEGAAIAVLAGMNGLPRWIPFLDRLAEHRRVVLLSPPGFPGSDAQHEVLDNHLDWLTATLDLLDAAGLERCDMVAASIGAILALDVAALDGDRIGKLSLSAPYGIYDTTDPVPDYFAQIPDVQRNLLCRDGELFDAAFGDPEDPAAAAIHQLTFYRAAVASARLSWPLGDRGAAKRLHRIKAPVQLLWGSDDRLMPRGYADLFAQGLPAVRPLVVIPDAGHLAWIDQPSACASAVLEFLGGTPTL